MRFTRFTDDDARLLAELRPLVEENAVAMVDRFYEHLLGADELQPFLADPATVERLKRAQRDYLVRLASGVYDEQYARDRRRIGEAHERLGIEPQWFLGSYGLYTDLFEELIGRRFRDDAAKASRASAALSKLLALDVQLVLDVYYASRERRAVEHNEQLAAVGELAASIAHEVRNPLAGMKGALQVLRGDLEVKPSNAEIVDELLAQIDRLERLVRDLLTYARPSALSRQPFDLHELLDRLLRGYKEATEAAGITVRRSYGPGTSRIEADLQQLEQVFHNLIQNAVQAMEGGGVLTVSTTLRRAARTIEITFGDTGKGIVPTDLVRVFQPFYTTKHRGSGLGLPIVKKIVEAHGGTVEMSSEPGAGTTTTLHVPSERKETDGA
jgi:signal transduction histidine kinase